MDAINAASGTQSSSGGGASSSSGSSTTFDKKDTNQDGTVSTAEELAYDLQHGTGNLSASDVSNVVIKALEQYAQTSGNGAQAGGSGSQASGGGATAGIGTSVYA